MRRVGGVRGIGIGGAPWNGIPLGKQPVGNSCAGFSEPESIASLQRRSGSKNGARAPRGERGEPLWEAEGGHPQKRMMRTIEALGENIVSRTARLLSASDTLPP